MVRPERVILNILTNARTRMHQQVLLQKVTSALFCGLLLLAILFVVNRLILLPMRITDMSLLGVLGAVGVGICLGFRHRKDLRAVARIVDLRMGLKERLSTAYQLISADDTSAFAQFQIRDTANAVSDRREHLSATFPYRVPGILKAVPIPLLFIVFSFAVPRLYDVPPPLTVAQQQVVDAAVQNLEKLQTDTPQIRETVNKLKAAKDVRDAQAQLSALNTAVRKQQVEQAAEVEAAIAEATQATPRFKGMNANELSAELEALAEQPEISPELQAELAELFARLAERLPNTLLAEIQGKAVSPETLRDIAEVLRQVKAFPQLAQLEAQLTASRKELALASIEPQNSSGGVANNDGAPGQEAGNGEVQGTLETVPSESPARLESVSMDKERAGDRPPRYGEESLLTGDETPSLQVNGEQLTLTTEPSADSQRLSRVFTGAEALRGDGSYRLFSDVVLNAKREYAQAIENNRIPVRYRAQIKAYLEAIAIGKEN